MTSDEIIQWLKEKRDGFAVWDDRYEDLDNLIAELQEEIENRAKE